MTLQRLFRLAAFFVMVASPFSIVQAANPSGKGSASSSPVLLPGEYAVTDFTLARGVGNKWHSCLGHVTIGPGIAPGDLEVTYVKENSIRIAIKGTGDALVCAGFYTPAMRHIAHKTVFRFYDTNRWHFDDIDKRANLRARATSTIAGSIGPAPTTASKAAPTPAPGATAQQAPGNISKCVSADGRTTYKEGPCPDGKSAKQPAAAAGTTARNAVLPTVQPGLWKLKVNHDGRESQSDLCGDPLRNIAEEIARTASIQNMGCIIRSASSSSRSFNMAVDCPADRVSEDGSFRVRKGQTNLSVDVPTPQSLTISLQSTMTANHQTIQGVRIGDC